MALLRTFALATMLVWSPLFAGDDEPVLSTGGRRKTEQYLRMLTDQARSIQDSLGNIRRNTKIIRDEISELDALEREHLALLQKLDAHSKSATDAVEANNSSIATAKGSADEKTQREAWKKENEPVAAESKKTAADIRASLQGIVADRLPLKKKLQEWMQQERDYSAALEKIRTRRLEVERMVTGSAP